MKALDLPPWMEPFFTEQGFPCSKIVLGFASQRERFRGYLRKATLGQPERIEDLRSVAKKQLTAKKPELVDRALGVLFIAGEKEDIPAITQLAEHESDVIRNSAKACIFEINQRTNTQEQDAGG